MTSFGHTFDDTGRASRFRVFAPGRGQVFVVIVDPDKRVPMSADPLGYWTAEMPRLAEGTRYWIEIDGHCWPDTASRSQPDGVHAASAIALPRRAQSPGWRGVRIEDAIIYELHLGTFTPEGTLVAAMDRLPYLQDLGITVVELLPIAAFPGHRNWGYDGTYPFALHADYGRYADLQAFIERAHALGIAVLLDVVYNHFGPEGNYTAFYGPYTRTAETPWGAAVNLDGPYNHGVRAFFLENARYWLEDIGFDGFRMDAVSVLFDNMPVHLLREFTDLARRIGAAEGREVLMIAEHLRNNRHVTSAAGYAFHAQWSDDLNYTLFACLTGERSRHYANFGSFDDAVRALKHGFVLDGTRFDQVHHYLLGTDPASTQATEHIVHIQNHDQVGNRPFGDRMIATYGRERALLAITAVMASAFVPMLFMGEDYGETAPFLFFEDFSDRGVIDGVREGRKADYDFGSAEPPDPHARSSFEASRLHWERAETAEGLSMRDHYRTLIALKRSGRLGPRDRAAVAVSADEATRVVRIETAHTLTLLCLAGAPQDVAPIDPQWQLRLRSGTWNPASCIGAYAALVFERN